MIWYVGISSCTLKLEVAGSCEIVASLYQTAWNHITSCFSCSSLNALCVIISSHLSLASKPSVNSFLLSVMHLVMISAWLRMVVARSCMVESRYVSLQIDCVTCCSKYCAFSWLLRWLHREYKIWHVISQLAHSCVYVNGGCIYVNWGVLVCGWYMPSGISHERTTVKCSIVTVNWP